MKKEKKDGAFGRILIAILIALFAILFLFEVGTIFPKIPLFGSIGSFFTMFYGHILLLVLLLLSVLGIALLFIKKLPKGKIAVCVLILASCAINFYCYYATIADLNKQGTDLSYNFFEYFKKEDVSDVKKEIKTYCTTPYGENELNVYFVEDGKKDKPVIVYIHGGGWVQGSKDDHTYESQLLAKAGYVVISADYTLSTAEKHMAGKAEEELTHAFAWAKNNAPFYGGKAEEVYALGDSAGGNLALLMSYKINAGIYTEADGTSLPRVKKATALYPVVSPKTYYENEDIVLKWEAKRMAKEYVGATPDEDPEGYAKVTVTNFVTDQTPPTLFILGGGDTDVQPEQSNELAALLQEKGIDNKMIVAKYCNHAFDNADGNFGCLAVVGEIKKFFAE